MNSVQRAIAKAFFAVLIASICLPALAEEFKGKVVAVKDGDSLLVLHNGSTEKVILYGIDCPEAKQDYGPQAREFTEQNCKDKSVSVSVKGHDRFERVIAEVFLPDGSSLNQELLKQGCAWWSDKYAAKDATLKQLHMDAKAKRIGLWSNPKAVPPWIFRNGEKSVQAIIKPAQ